MTKAKMESGAYIQNGWNNELESHAPAGNFLFNKGLGTSVPRAILRRIVVQNNTIEDKLDLIVGTNELKNVLNEKALDPEANRFREMLGERVRRLGFDPSTNSDEQFHQLNDMASTGILLMRSLRQEGYKPFMPDVVNAVIFYRRPDWQSKLEITELSIKCTCGTRHGFLKLSEGEKICLGCGKELGTGKTAHHIRRLNLEYIDRIHRIVLGKLGAARLTGGFGRCKVWHNHE